MENTRTATTNATQETCSECGQMLLDLHIETTTTTQGLICPSCLAKHCTTCDACEDTIHIDNTHAIGDDTILCDLCFYESYSYCEKCGDVVHNDDSITVDSKTYCEDCFDIVGYKCADCGEYGLIEDGHYHNDDDEDICEDCSEYYYCCEQCDCVIHSDYSYSIGSGIVLCRSCYNDHSNNHQNHCDTIQAYQDAMRIMMEGTSEFDIFKNSWKDEFIPTIAEFYTIQLFKELNRRPDGLNMFDYSSKDTRTDKYKIHFYNAIYHAVNPSVVDNLHASSYWCGFMDKNDTREAQIITSLEKFFLDYIFIACVGEARHAAQCSDLGGYIPEWLPLTGNSSSYCSRDDVWFYGYWLLQQCRNNPSEWCFQDMCEDLFRVFDENNWTSSYGGAKWANIINHLCRYLNDEMDKTIFVDQSVSLVHNGSLFVDKLGVNVSKVKRLLDLKFAAMSQDIPEVISYIKTAHIMYRYTGGYEFACNMLGLNTLKQEKAPEKEPIKVKYVTRRSQ